MRKRIFFVIMGQNQKGQNAMKKKLISLMLMLCLLAGCTEKPSAETVPQDMPQDTQSSNAEELSQQQVYEMLFDIENTIHLDLDMTDAELAKMQLDYETYDRNGGKIPCIPHG